MDYEPQALPADTARRIEFAAMVADAQLAEASRIVDARGMKGSTREPVVLALLDAISRNYAASLS